MVLVEIRQRAAAQQRDHAVKLELRGAEQVRIDVGIALQRISEVVCAIGDKHVIVVEECIQPQADEMVHPVAIEIVVQLVNDIMRGRDVFQFAQHAMPAVGDRIGQQQALLLQLHIVRPARGGQHRTDHANDRKRNDDPNGDHAGRARTSDVSPPAELFKRRQSLSPHGAPPGNDVRIRRTLGRCCL